MIKKALELLAAPVCHLVLSLLFMYHIGTVSIGRPMLALWIVLLLTASCFVSMLTAKRRWHASLATIGLYFLLFVAFSAVRMAVVNKPDLSAEYYGVGMMQYFIGLPVSLGTIVLGSIQGQLLSYLLQGRVERMSAAFTGRSKQPLEITKE